MEGREALLTIDDMEGVDAYARHCRRPPDILSDKKERIVVIFQCLPDMSDMPDVFLQRLEETARQHVKKP